MVFSTIDLSTNRAASLFVSPVVIFLKGLANEEATHRRANHPDLAAGRGARNADSGRMPGTQHCRTDAFFRWRNKYGGMEVSDARKLKELEGESAKLKRMVAEHMLVIEGLRSLPQKNELPGWTTRGAAVPDESGSLPASGLPTPEL